MSNLINGKKYAVTFYVEELGESKTEEATYNEAEESFFFCEFERIGIHKEWADSWVEA